MPRVSAKLAKATVKAPNALLVTVPYLKVVEPDLVPRRGEPYSNSSLIVESVVERCVVGKPGAGEPARSVANRKLYSIDHAFHSLYLPL